MRPLFLALLALAAALASGCQSGGTGGIGGNTSGSRQPIGPPQTIAEESRAVQGGSFGNR